MTDLLTLDRLKADRDQLAERVAHYEQTKRLGLIRVRDGRDLYLFEDRASEVTLDLNANGWRGTLTLAVYSPVVDYAAFQRVVELMFKAGFAGRIVGKPLLLHGVKFRHTSRAETDAADGAAGVLTIEYTALRVPPAGTATETDDGYAVRAVVLP